MGLRLLTSRLEAEDLFLHRQAQLILFTTRRLRLL
jgi:hypothetical protein